MPELVLEKPDKGMVPSAAGLISVRLPNLIGIETQPFDPATYDGDEYTDEVLKSEMKCVCVGKKGG